jgi:two-component system, sporulation sensor kinase B
VKKVMLFLFLALWSIGIFLLFIDGKNANTRWVSATALFGGAGGLSVVIEERVIPFAQQITDVPYIHESLYFLEILSTAAFHYFIPYAFLMFAISYSGYFPAKWKKRMRYILLLPAILMLWWFPFFPEFVVPYKLILLWEGPYIVSGIFLLLYSYFNEQNPLIKQNRLLISLAFVPAISFSLFTNYIFRAFGIDDAWRLNGWIIAFSLVVFVYSIAKSSFMGLKLSVERQRLNQSMEIMASGAEMFDHALKNDLGKIKLFATKIAHYARKAEHTELQEDIQVIQDTQDHMQTILADIRNQVQDIHLHLHKHSLNDIIDQVVSQLKPRLQQQRIVVTQQHDSDVTLLCDRFHVEELFYNICTNAVEAMPDGGELMIKAYEQKDQLIVEIIDTGAGIAEEHISKVFDPFFSTKTYSNQNYGLGLSYCYKIMKKHGGKLNINSTENKGTTVSVSFPIATNFEVGRE